jgi:putative oxidoreductase
VRICEKRSEAIVCRQGKVHAERASNSAFNICKSFMLSGNHHMSLCCTLYGHFLRITNLLAPAVLMLVRVWIARVFFLSGLVKIANFDTTVALFAAEYQVPVLSPLFAAVSATAFELLCPVLLVLGLGTRLAVLPLLAMTAVIQFTYDQNIQHTYWALLLLVLLSGGPGMLSVDHLIKRRWGKAVA